MTNSRTIMPSFAQLPVEGLKVTGEAVRELTPEVIELGFDIHGMGSTAAFALQDCAIRMMQIGQALTSLGITQTDLQAGPMSVRAIPMPAQSLSSRAETTARAFSPARWWTPSSTPAWSTSW